MVLDNMMEKSGNSIRPNALQKKQCEYYLFESKEQDQPPHQREITTVSAGENMPAPFNESE
jgi:hypothetical protein